jgi:Na+/H+ antiporter NhaA
MNRQPGPLRSSTILSTPEISHYFLIETQCVEKDKSLIRETASQNLSAERARLLSPAERIERAVAPWSAYFILPQFAFSAIGISVAFDLRSADDLHVLFGVILGLVLGKPIGVLVAS